MKIQVNDTNYSYYKKIFEIIVSHLSSTWPSEVLSKANPIETLNQWELKNKTRAKRGLKAGLLDLISQIKEFPLDLRKSIDQDLIANNLPKLSGLEGLRNKIVSRVLKRQQIKNLEEFYVIKEVVIDLVSSLTKANRIILDKCLMEFEFSQMKGKS